jgi:hypothetical protein
MFDSQNVTFYALINIFYGLKKGKVIPIKGHAGPKCCEMSRIPHFLDRQLTDGSEVVRLTRWLPFTSRKIPGTHFCYEAESNPGS